MTAADQYIWWIQALVYMANTLVPSFNGAALIQAQQTLFGTSDEAQADAVAGAKAAGDFSGWSAAWNTWWSNRANDGSVAAAVPPTAADLPNGAIFLETTTSQDIAGYPNPRKWTPLSINGAQKKYLTTNWESVTSTCLSAADELSIKTAAQTAFLGTSPARDTEISDLVSLSQTLTDEQKIIAEFWAGGPNTLTPPGMFIWLWRTFAVTSNLRATKGIDGVFLSGLQLAAELFEGSRMTWALKKQFFEARPIQEIRRAYASSTLVNYDGSSVAGNLWIPYQVTSFVTPPFPDFPSGHSTFGQVFANVMTEWFGNSIPDISAQSYSALPIWSPIFGAAFSTNWNTIPIAAGSSEIQAGVVPAAPITLSWGTWQEMADSCGVSRQYGGIHCVSAHIGGQSVANETHSRAKVTWGIQV
jgi:membrane-associated phospholipid phosphatase